MVKSISIFKFQLEHIVGNIFANILGNHVLKKIEQPTGKIPFGWNFDSKLFPIIIRLERLRIRAESNSQFTLFVKKVSSMKFVGFITLAGDKSFSPALRTVKHLLLTLLFALFIAR
jgi:hypothetical protein